MQENIITISLIILCVILIIAHYYYENQHKKQKTTQLIPEQKVVLTDFERELLRYFIFQLPITDERLIKEFDFVKIETKEPSFPKFRYKDTRLAVMNNRGHYIPLFGNEQEKYDIIGKEIFKCGELHQLIESIIK